MPETPCYVAEGFQEADIVSDVVEGMAGAQALVLDITKSLPTAGLDTKLEAGAIVMTMNAAIAVQANTSILPASVGKA